MENDFSEKLGSLLSDPAAMAKIMNLAGSLGLGSSPPPPPKEPEPPCTSCQAKDALPCGGGCPFPKNNGVLSETAKCISDSRALLIALKPFLSSERCERIDKILGMMKIAEIMGYLK